MKKLCKNCNCNKELSEFYKASNNKDGYRNSCKVCMNMASKEYERKGYNKLRSIKYYENIDIHRLKRSNRSAEQKERCALATKEYRKTPQGKLVAKNGNNKRRSKELLGSVTTEQLATLLKVDTCFYCKVDLNTTIVHIDHFIPLSKGGLHDIHNLVVSCAKCNLSKRDKIPEVYFKQTGKNPIFVYPEDFCDW